MTPYTPAGVVSFSKVDWNQRYQSTLRPINRRHCIDCRNELRPALHLRALTLSFATVSLLIVHTVADSNLQSRNTEKQDSAAGKAQRDDKSTLEIVPGENFVRKVVSPKFEWFFTPTNSSESSSEYFHSDRGRYLLVSESALSLSETLLRSQTAVFFARVKIPSLFARHKGANKVK